MKPVIDNPEDRYLGSPGLVRRLAAIGYDSILVFVLCMLTTTLVMGIKVALSGHEMGKVAIQGPALQLSLLLTVFVFYWWFWTRSGQTLGMQTWRIRLDSEVGGRISHEQALVRFLVAIPSMLLFGAGYWVMLLDSEKRTLPDRLSRSRLVLLPKQDKKKS